MYCLDDSIECDGNISLLQANHQPYVAQIESVLQCLADTEKIHPQFWNILEFFESHINTRAVKLNNMAFEASNLYCHQVFNVFYSDPLINILHITSNKPLSVLQ
jgi:hypothetical protein